MSNGTREKQEALRDLDYLIRLNAVHERLFSRLEKHARLIELVGGSAALFGAIGGVKWATISAGLLVAVVAYANIAFDFGKRARVHRRTRSVYVAVKADAATLSVEEIDRRRNQIADPTYIEGLRLPCYNEVMRNHGALKLVRPLSGWQQVMDAIA